MRLRLSTTLFTPVTGVDLDATLSDAWPQRTTITAAYGHLLVQRYEKVGGTSHRLELRTAAGRVYLYHLIPARLEGRWILEATDAGDTTTVFSSTFVVERLPLVLRMLGPVTGLRRALRRRNREQARQVFDVLHRAGDGPPTFRAW
ncbi:hypothetical protein [Cryptosporangium phraense]|uniref:hypothetical protein n=1 Tax=Cryptosporangium phraense TaxID=2593070 RepID=UPI001478209A|nr:hypothetical protein [Cryptosporangium phraense]